MSEEKTIFATLNAINCNDHTENKNGLTYLSWCYAWAEVKKKYPNATYSIYRNAQTNLPYDYDANTGYMCYTSVTINDLTHTMWLPVMDSANHAMKAEPYTIKTKYKEIPVDAATMFDVNKTIMRCLTKNLAMFGLGLYIYAGEDLPEGEETEQPKKPVYIQPQAHEDKKVEQEPTEYTCEACGAKISPYSTAKATYDAKWVSDYTFTKFGKHLCMNCGAKEGKQ